MADGATYYTIGLDTSGAVKQVNILEEALKRARGGTDSIKNAFSSVQNNGIKALKNVAKAATGDFRKSMEQAAGTTESVGEAAKAAEPKLEEMGKTGKSAGSGIEKAMGKAFGAFLGVKAVKKAIRSIKDFIGSSLEAAKTAEQVGAQFGRLFEDSAAAEWADKFGKSIKRSTSDVKGFMVQSKVLFQELGLTGKTADNLSQIMTGLAYDMGSAFKIEDAAALDMIKDAIGGNTSALAAYGFKLDEAVLKSEAMKLGITMNVGAMDDATLAMLRMNAVMAQSTDIQGAATSSAGSLVNQMKEMGGIKNMLYTLIGEKLAPVISVLLEAFNSLWESIEPIVDILASELSAALSEIVPVIAELAKAVLPILTKIVGMLLPIISNLVKTLLPPLVKIAEALGPILDAFSPILEMVGEMFAFVGDAIGDLIDDILPPLINYVMTCIEAWKPLLNVLMKVVMAALPPLMELIKALLPLLDIFCVIIDALAPILEIVGKVLEWVADLLAKLIGWLANGIGKVVGFFGNLFGGAKKSAGAVGELGDAFDDLGISSGKIGALEIAAPSLPKNAMGTDYFGGGWTRMNELGGELAFLPSGSAIVPADQTDNMISGGDTGYVYMGDFSPQISITVQGNADEVAIDKMKDQIKRLMRAEYERYRQEELEILTLKNAYT